ncbi:hypothetical protein DSO57_1013605 [Entomophthora muscae]|uniref:Uncharacterized protein n=1 Tax=Entomophthora muscae TaxID=34485 RepID=A0ACC2TTB0_9FUNG|nr:hypothetical protein DSO57_1013605 [Entomophthora muscae]
MSVRVLGNVHKMKFVATRIPLSPANLSHDTQWELNELPHDISNSMDQPEGKVKLRALSPN